MIIENKSIFIRPKKIDFKGSSWVGHVPFGSWLVSELKPNVIVELGTHKGLSFLTFCESIKENKLSSNAYAIDTWKGDHQAGYYGDEIYNELKEYVDENYFGFAHLLRKTFDEASYEFENNSVDLLHIDGLHTYEAVKHDFEVWFPKLSDKAVVIFHDTSETKDDFGVYKFWNEILKNYPGFEFKFWHGLGVLLVGNVRNNYLESLSENNSNNSEFSLFNFIFENLANDLRIKYEREELEKILNNEVTYARNLENRIRGDESTLNLLHEEKNKFFDDNIKLINDLNEEIDKNNLLTENFKKIEDENRVLNDLINKVYLSKSWRITKTFRNSADILRGKGYNGNKVRFNERWYLKNNIDVKNSGMNPYEHYINFGKKEGRKGAPDTLIVTSYKKLKITKNIYCELRNRNIKFIEIIKKTSDILKNSGINGLKEKIRTFNKIKFDDIEKKYEDWIKYYDTISLKDKLEIIKQIESLKYRPLFSILMPVYNTDPFFLRQALDSIINQIYENWELCIADDNSTNIEVKKILKEYEEKDNRIKIVYREENGHISRASNSALDLVVGEYTALMDHDDLLPSHALYMIVNELNKCGCTIDLIYTDEDKIDGDNKRYDPYFKMDWNETLIYSQNFVAHLGVYRTSILKKIGGFRDGFEGSQDYDMLLRFLKETNSNKILHIPHILYHWRIFKGNSTFSTDNHKVSDTSAYKALSEHFNDVNKNVEILQIEDFPGSWRIKKNISDFYPKVSLIIPTRDRFEILKNCVDGLNNNTDYDDFEIIIVDNESKEKATLEYFNEIREIPRVKILRIEGEFNYSKLNNLAVKEAKGKYLVFMNNDLEIINSYWLKEMISTFYDSNIGIVGAKLYYKNDKIQHAGCVTGIYGVAGHIHRHWDKKSPGYFGRLLLQHEVSAVTGACLAISKEIFEEVSGFDEEKLKVSYNDVDLCLKVKNKGYKIIFNPNIELYHLESISRGQDIEKEKRELNRTERREMISRYGKNLKYDPYYNPNLSLDNEDLTYSFEPRIIKPWRDYIEFICPFHRGDVLIGIQVANYYHSIGKNIRFHVSKDLINWVNDFSPEFEVLEIPIDLPKAIDTMEYFEKSVEFVRMRDDFSGRIARSHPKMDFDFMGLNILENMLNELDVSIDSKIVPLKPIKKFNLSEDFKYEINKLYDDNSKVILIHPFGGWDLKNIPLNILDEIVEVCKNKNIKLIQIGGKDDKKIPNLDGWILKNYSLSEWRIIFEKSDLLIGVDSWTSHLSAILNTNQIVLYGSTRGRDVNIKKFLTEQNDNYIILESNIDCSPCHLLECKYKYAYCKGYNFDKNMILRFLNKSLYD